MNASPRWINDDPRNMPRQNTTNHVLGWPNQYIRRTVITGEHACGKESNVGNVNLSSSSCVNLCYTWVHVDPRNMLIQNTIECVWDGITDTSANMQSLMSMPVTKDASQGM